MQAFSCTAILKDQHGKFLERGSISLSDQPNSIDFNNDFVPLFKMGTSLTIVPIINQQELTSITGQVYLSSSRYLRLTAIDQAALAELEEIFYTNINLHTELAHYVQSKLYFSYKNAAKAYAFIYFISLDRLKFFTLDKLKIDQKLMLNINSPLNLKKIIIQINDIQDFGGMAPSYICSFQNLTNQATISITNYLESLKS